MDEIFEGVLLQLKELNLGVAGTCICSSFLGEGLIRVAGGDFKFVAGQMAYFPLGHTEHKDDSWYMMRDHHCTLEQFIEETKNAKDGDDIPCHCWLENEKLIYDFALGLRFEIKDIYRDRSEWADQDAKPFYLPSKRLTGLLKQNNCEDDYY